MNILLSTTIGHNPGDELIRDGVISVLKAAYPHTTFNFISYNRNPDLQLGDGREARANTVGNYQTSPVDLSYIDMVVLAGSPEWFGGPMKALYEALRSTPTVPLYALGIGLGNPNEQLNALEQLVLSFAKKIITRSQETTDFLKKYAIESKAMVCPALFSSNQVYSACLVRYPLNIVQAPGHAWHEIHPKCLGGLESVPGDLGMVHVKELKHFHNMKPNKVYMSSSEEFKQRVNKYERVNSTRLHGAVGALSLGIPSVVVSRGDFRIETAAKMFGEYLPVARDFNEANNCVTKRSLDIIKFKSEQKALWVTELLDA